MERLADEALAIAVRAGINGADVLHVSHVQFLRREQGRYDEVEGSIVAIMSRYPRLAESWRLALTNVYAQTGRADKARRELGALAGSGVSAAGRGHYTIAVMALLTEAVVALGDVERAEELYDRLLPYDRRCIVNGATPNFYGPASYYLGCLAGTLGRTDAAIEHLQQALTMNRRLGVPTLIARSELTLAVALLGRGGREDREQASVLAEQARGTAVALGMARAANEAQALIARTRTLVERRGTAAAVSVPYGELTARQVEVLRLLASGKSNREIAEALSVSVNTVERHLVTIYGRLGVQTRTAATAYAHQHGLG
jgi:DNA-binding NarL/FixJ family response regulator